MKNMKKALTFIAALGLPILFAETSAQAVQIPEGIAIYCTMGVQFEVTAQGDDFIPDHMPAKQALSIQSCLRELKKICEPGSLVGDQTTQFNKWPGGMVYHSCTGTCRVEVPTTCAATGVIGGIIE